MRANWTETALGVVATLGNGGAWGADEPGDGLVDAACLRGTDLADLINGEQPAAPVRWLKESELTKARCVENMILIETSGSKCGRSVLLTKKMLGVFERPVVFSNFCRTLRIDLEKIMNKYAELWFSHAYATGLIPSYRATSAMPNLDIKSLLRIEKMLIPPLSEQKRIVDVTKAVDAYIAALQQQADGARTARSAVLHELLTAGGADWTETTLGQIAGLVMGKTPPRNEKRYWTDELAHPFCTIADMEGKWIRPKREGVTSAAIQDAKARKVAAGSLMMSFKLTIGRVGFAGVDLYPNEAIVAIDVDNRISTKEFLYLVLGSQDLTHGSGRAIKGATLNSASLAAIPLVLPPLAEQKRIVETVTAMDDVVSTTEQAARVAQELRAGLLSTLLSGEHGIPDTYDRLLGAA